MSGYTEPAGCSGEDGHGGSTPPEHALLGGWPLKVLLLLLLVAAVLFEFRTSWLQSKLLTAVARRSTYSLGQGPSPTVRFPRSAPYADRLGYSRLSTFLPALGKGALMTLLLVLCTMLVSPLGGLLIALGRISTLGPVSGLCWFIIWFFRGTPLLLQLFFIYYGLPSLGITLAPLTAAVIGLGLNYSAYLGEIIRGAIQSIDHGQMEAAKAIGMSYGQAMRRVIIPQTYKRLMPPIGNEFIALIKDTALVSTIAMVELMRAADQLFNTYFNITALALAAVIYLVLTTIFTFIFEKIEYRAGIYEHR